MENKLTNIVNKNIKLFVLDNSRKIGNEISKLLKIPVSGINKIVFNDGEILIGPNDSVRNKHVFVVCSSAHPINESIMEVLIFVDALKRASALTINLVITYFGYARQDRKSSGRQPITAKLHADLLATAGITKLITIDLHNPSIQGFFDLPVDDLRGQYILAKQVDKKKRFLVVSPDHGGATRANLLAKLISGQDKTSHKIAIIDKVRTGPNKSKIRGILGSVKGRNCILIDDLIDTGGTIIHAASELKKHGAKKVVVMATHGLFSKGFTKFENAKDVDAVYISNSLPSVYDIEGTKLKIISLAPFISKVIQATYRATSITSIYSRFAKSIKKISLPS